MELPLPADDRSFSKRLRCYMMHKLKIVTHGNMAHFYLDGQEISNKLCGYTVEQDAGGVPVVGMRFIPSDVEIDADEVEVDDV